MDAKLPVAKSQGPLLTPVPKSVVPTRLLHPVGAPVTRTSSRCADTFRWQTPIGATISKTSVAVPKPSPLAQPRNEDAATTGTQVEIVVEVRAECGREAVLAYDSNASFGTLTKSVQTQFHIQPHLQKLLFRGEELVFGSSAPLTEVFGAQCELFHIVVSSQPVPPATTPSTQVAFSTSAPASSASSKAQAPFPTSQRAAAPKRVPIGEGLHSPFGAEWATALQI